MHNLQTFISVLLAVIIILIASQLFGRLFVVLKQPKVVGEMVCGVLLGPTCFGYFFPAISGQLFKADIMPFLFVLSNIGLSFYMFIVALEIDFEVFDKKLIKDSMVLSAATIIAPFALGIAAAVLYFDDLHGENANLVTFCIFMGTALAITAFPMLARILHENNLTKTRIGSLSLISASIQDVVSWIFLAFATAYAKKEGSEAGIITLVGGVIFILLMFFVIKPLLKYMTAKLKSESEVPQNYFAFIVIVLLVCALLTDYIGLYSVFGGFVLGLVIPRKQFIVKGISDKMKDMTVVLLLPLFFTFSGLNANLLVMKELNVFIPCIMILLFSFLGKYVISAIVMKGSGFSWRESSAIGGMMNARGLMELVIANIGLMYGVITPVLYSILVLMAIISTFAAMPIYNWSLNPKKTRLKENAGEAIIEKEVVL
ncbi:MAG TPA: cation:proton antiporter [Bacteroidia bacterium]|jgi:Kef-type K+ transport system membrane component KefB